MSEICPKRAWRVLAIDDETQSLELIKEILEADPLRVSGEVVVFTETNFDAALDLLERYRIDLVILDIRLGDGPEADFDAGTRTRAAVHKARFVPIVFFTGLPNYADPDADSPFVDVVTKGSSPHELRDSVDKLLASGAPEVQRVLVTELERTIRNFMLDYVAPRWAGTFEGESGKTNLAHILARRLSVALTGTELSRVIEGLGFASRPEAVDPLRYYVVPPISTIPMVGDLHRVAEVSAEAESDSWWIVLTPTCDLAQDKADFALLARCSRLDQTEEFQDVSGDLEASNSKKKRLEEIIRNGRSLRHHYLPAAFDLPHLVVDFQDLRTVSRKTLNAMMPEASLDSPFAEELQSRFAAYFGRIGTPDLDWEAVIAAIQNQG